MSPDKSRSGEKTILVINALTDERSDITLEELNHYDYRIVFCSDAEFPLRHDKVDKLYIVDMGDRESILSIAKSEKIDGVVGLCDDAIISASYVSEMMGLPGNSVASIERLMSKSAFRELQKDAGVFSPNRITLSEEQVPWDEIRGMSFPVIIKPMLCSGSFGHTIVNAYDENSISQGIAKAASFSRNKLVCIEEYVESADDSLRIVEGEAFVVNDDILWDGIRYSYRTKDNNVRPVYDVYPVDMSKSQLEEIKHTVGTLLRRAGVRIGEYNYEGFFNKDGRFFVIEINPRQPGMYNPLHVYLQCGVNLTKLLISTAMSDMSYYNELKSFTRKNRHMITFSAFCNRAGILESVYIDDSLKDKVIDFRYFDGLKEGSYMVDKNSAFSPAAKITFEFSDSDELERYRKNIEKLVYPVMV